MLITDDASRRHAEVYTETALTSYVRDLGSKNGTF